VALLTTWAFDTGAFLAGRLIGRRPFMSHVSPSKTVEGFIGGLVFGAAAGTACAPAIHIRLWEGIALGVAGGIAAQAGDLVESMIKRQSGVKDSSSLIPGHGGVLDRIDSLLFTGVVTYYAAALFGYGS
jgi:phosphatidate cytidylyltransferase